MCFTSSAFAWDQASRKQKATEAKGTIIRPKQHTGAAFITAQRLSAPWKRHEGLKGSVSALGRWLLEALTPFHSKLGIDLWRSRRTAVLGGARIRRSMTYKRRLPKSTVFAMLVLPSMTNHTASQDACCVTITRGRFLACF